MVLWGSEKEATLLTTTYHSCNYGELSILVRKRNTFINHSITSNHRPLTALFCMQQYHRLTQLMYTTIPRHHHYTFPLFYFSSSSTTILVHISSSSTKPSNLYTMPDHYQRHSSSFVNSPLSSFYYSLTCSHRHQQCTKSSSLFYI